ncbi:MAG: FkbM family methyltransferase [Magnetospirillum sp.]|nr:FkbM family methyltransferase [Magnetospirillum sp.]
MADDCPLETVFRMQMNRLAEAGPAFFVQVGANDGVYDDPIRPYVLQHGWPGLLIEPLPDMFAQLTGNYADQPQLRFENCAIGPAGSLPIYRMPVGIGAPSAWYHGLASFRREVIASHAPLLKNLDRMIVEETVRCVPFMDLMAQHGIRTMDILLTDTEGYDLEVLRQVDFTALTPKVVYTEIRHLSPADLAAMRDLLTGHDYEVYTFPGRPNLVAAHIPWLDSL